MSRLKTQLDEAARLNWTMHAELERLMKEAEKDGGFYWEYDEYKADAYEAAVELLDSILDAHADEKPGITLRFGDGTDSDTFNNVFGHLADAYVVEVNGTDMVCFSTGDPTAPGLFGLVWDDEKGKATDKPIRVSWDDLESVTIY